MFKAKNIKKTPTGEPKNTGKGTNIHGTQKKKTPKENVRVRLRPYAYAAICMCFRVRMSVCVFSMRVRLCVYKCVHIQRKKKECAAEKRKKNPE